MQGPLTFQYGYEMGGSPAEVFARCPTTEASFMNLSMAFLAKDCPCVLAPAGSGKSGMLKVGPGMPSMPSTSMGISTLLLAPHKAGLGTISSAPASRLPEAVCRERADLREGCPLPIDTLAYADSWLICWRLGLSIHSILQPTSQRVSRSMPACWGGIWR